MEDFVLSLEVILFAGWLQNVPGTMSVNHVKQDTDVDK